MVQLETSKSQSMPMGIVIRRLPGVTRWAKWVWKPVSVLPGAGEAEWQILRQEENAVEYHAATLPLELHRTDTEAYRTALSEKTPSLYVVLRESDSPTRPMEVLLVTASPYEGQDYADTGEEIVEKVPMPPGVIAWIDKFVRQHHEDERFIKRRRDKANTGKIEDGVGDARIRQLTDVYRTPGSKRGKRLQ